MNKLQITKDNYKGYVELFKAYSPDDISLNMKDKIYFYSILSFLEWSLAMLASLFAANIAIPIFVLVFIFNICKIAHTSIQFSNYNKSRFENVYSNYPYVDKNINLKELSKILSDAKILNSEIIKINNKDVTFYSLDVDDYEKKLNEKKKKQEKQEALCINYQKQINTSSKEKVKVKKYERY